MIKKSEKTKKLLDLDHRYVSPSYTRDYPFIMHRGNGMEVVDIDNNTYLDFTAGIAVNATGHGHPAVKRAIHNQVSKFVHMSGTDFFYESQIDLAVKLASLSPFKDPKVFFCNSGAEAVEAAMKLSRYNTDASTYIAFYGAFHGRTLGALSLTASKPIQRRGFEPLMSVNHTPYANCNECLFNCNASTCIKEDSYQCLSFLEDYILDKKVHPDDVAAIFVEPVQGEGGYIVPPKGWLNKLVNLAHRKDILIVFDEIQSGMGRTGKWWAHEHFGVQPDMITSAKGLASGMPLGALITPDHLMEWPPGAHASTFGGNPISCASALATIDVIEQDKLLDNVKNVGNYLGIILENLTIEIDVVNNSRGLGFMQAIDIAGDGELRNKILMSCFDKGLLLLGCGKSGIRFCPSLIAKRGDIDDCAEKLESAIRDNI